MKDASRFIAEVLEEEENITSHDLEDYIDWDEDEVLLLVAEGDDGSFAGFAGVVYEDWNDTGVDEKKAIKFYERNGFSREAILKDWYDDGDDAVLLSRRVT